MRIGIDARFYGGEQSKGLGRYTQKLITYLARQDTKNDYVIFLQEKQLALWDIANPRFHPVCAPYRWYTLAEQLFMPLCIARAKVDLMHFPHFNVPLFYRGPFVVTIHDLIILHFPTERATTLGPLFYKFKHWAGKLVMAHAVRKAERIITVSSFSKHDILSYYHCDPAKVIVTYEGVEKPSAASRENEKSILRHYGIERPYFLYVGNAYPHKNLESLLNAVQQMAHTQPTLPFQLVLVGKEDYFYHRLAASARVHGVLPYVLFVGFVPDKHLATLYRNAVAYIFPSFMEGFGLPPLEAIAHGTPVVAARSSALPEILGDAALYFDPHELSGIITAMSTVFSDKAKRQELIRRGYERINRFTWERMSAQTLRIYDELRQTHTQNSHHSYS